MIDIMSFFIVLINILTFQWSRSSIFWPSHDLGPAYFDHTPWSIHCTSKEKKVQSCQLCILSLMGTTILMNAFVSCIKHFFQFIHPDVFELAYSFSGKYLFTVFSNIFTPWNTVEGAYNLIFNFISTNGGKSTLPKHISLHEFHS